MRKCSHKCGPCSTIDKVHEKRHTVIGDILRELYQHCGLDTSIVPPGVAITIEDEQPRGYVLNNGVDTRPPEVGEEEWDEEAEQEGE